MKLAVLFSSFVLFFVGSVHYPLILPRPHSFAINFRGILVPFILPQALLACLQLSRFALVSRSPLSLGKA